MGMDSRDEIRDESLVGLSANKAAVAQNIETTWYLLKVLCCQGVVAKLSIDPSQVIADCSIQQDFFPPELNWLAFAATDGQDNLEKLGARSQELWAVGDESKDQAG